MCMPLRHIHRCKYKEVVAIERVYILLFTAFFTILSLKNQSNNQSQDDMSNFEEAFELTGHGKFNNIVLVTGGCVLLYATTESLAAGYIISTAACELSMTVAEKGMVNAATFIGIVSTAIFWGYLSDRCGRRAVMMPTLLAAACTSFSSSLSTGFWSMFLLRVLTGCLVSASSATVYAYIGEMHTNARRSSAIAWGSVFISITFFVLPGLAWLILPGKWFFYVGSIKVVSWRVFMWSWFAPGLVASILLFILPESPRYLLASKSPEKALRVLALMFAWNNKKKKDDFPVKSIQITTTDIPNNLTGFKGICLSLGQMLKPPLLKCVLISHCCMFLVFMLSSGMYMWMPDIVNHALQNIKKPLSICNIMVNRNSSANHLSNHDTGAACEQNINSLTYPTSMTMGVLCALTYLAIGFLIEKFKKRHLFGVIVSICSLILVASVLVPQPGVGVVLFVLGLCSGCAASLLAAVAVEIFPTSQRALALCMLYMTGRLGAAVGANLLGYGLHSYCILVVICCALITAASNLLLFLWPEAKKVRAEMEARGLSY